MLKKSVSLLLALVMIFTVAVVLPVTASAALATPKITKLQSTASGVKLTIGAVKGAAKYRVFIKSGSAWKKLGDTAKTSWTYTKAKSGKKYTFTVRCLSANGKKYTSAYNKKGWSVTYKKPVDWSGLYQKYVLNKKHLTSDGGWGDNKSVARGYETFYLYDLDHNGIPELFIDFSYIGGSCPHNIYTVKNNKVTLLDKLLFGSSAVIYHASSKYNGLFSTGGRMGGYHTEYISMSGGKINVKNIVIDTWKENNSSEYNTTINDQTLYQVFMQCTKAGSEPAVSFRRAKNPLPTYDYQQVKKMGWNAFVKRYGY